jgi:filamentous hemagglutinin family protein
MARVVNVKLYINDTKYSVHKLLRLSGKIVMAGLVLPFSALTKAEVTLDGTLGPASSLTGPNFVIPDTVGQTMGINLFHSFGVFNINTGESATFTGPSSIENVLGRVTGGSSSFIDGLLRTQFENASPNLFLLNPAGVLFWSQRQSRRTGLVSCEHRRLPEVRGWRAV